MGITFDSVKKKMLGNTFNKLTVIEYLGRNGYHEHSWKCKCSCGEEVVRTTSKIRESNAGCTSCKIDSGIHRKHTRSHLIGKRFERLVVVDYAGLNPQLAVLWKCKCDCGSEVTVRTHDLNRGAVKSCGCYARDKLIISNRTHGLHNHKLYYVWSVMKDRLTNKNNKFFHRYGGRGIGLDPEWKDNFKSFYDWAMANGYQPGLTLERKDNDGNYEPDNCRWATRQEQGQNTSLTKITPDLVRMIKKDTRSNAALADAIGVNASTVSRIRNGKIWTNIQ